MQGSNNERLEERRKGWISSWLRSDEGGMKGWRMKDKWKDEWKNERIKD